MRGELSDEQLKVLRQRLPSLDVRFPYVLQLAQTTKESGTFVRLMSAGKRLEDMVLALVEAYACLTWYRELAPPPEHRIAEIVSARLYTDHATLIQYSADEDLAEFILQFCDAKTQYKHFEQNNPPDKLWSDAMRVDMFLRAILPHDPITEPFLTLHTNQAWQDALAYRNEWVHKQPPLLKGLGIQRSRESRLSLDGMYITFGGETEPELDIDQLLKMVHEATTACAICFSSLLDIVIHRHRERGEWVDTQFEDTSTAHHSITELGMRGRLTDEQLTIIAQKLPKLDARFPTATIAGPQVYIYDATHAPHRKHVAFVCLTDAGYRLAEIYYGLNEAYACLVWYRQFVSNAPQEAWAVLRAKFYIDHVALMQYAVAEDIAAFIIDFLAITDEFQKYMETGNPPRMTSNASKVGYFLSQKYRDHPITISIKRLTSVGDWRKATKYRNAWVHEQPPRVTGADMPEIDAPWVIDDLLKTVHTVTDALITCFSSLVDVGVDWRRKQGEHFAFSDNDEP